MQTYHVIAAAFLLHGIATAILGLRLPRTIRSGSVNGLGPSWILGGGRTAVVLGVVLWVLAGTAYMVAAVGFRLAIPWWDPAAWAGAVTTLVAVGLWAGAVPRWVYAGGALAVGTVAYLLLL